MKILSFFLIMGLSFFQFSCKSYTNKNTKSTPSIKVDTIVFPNTYLSKREPNCNHAILYMDSIIIPTYIVIGHVAGLPKVVYGSFEIKNEKISTYKSNKHLLYLNDQCFIGMPSRLIYDTFCPDSMVVSLLKADSINNKMNKILPIKLDLGGVVGLTFEIENSVIISSKFYKFTSSSE